jgi:superfamily I DNA/RNA helicase
LFSNYGKFLKEGRPAYVVGQEEALKPIVRLIDQVEKSKDYTNWQSFPEALKAHEEQLIEMLQDSGADPSRLIKEHDRCDIVRSCLTIFPDCRNSNDFKGELKRIFDPSPESVRLSSIHRAKGLEADNIYVLQPERVRIGWPTQQNWQAYQEQCCEYVMLTRAKKSLNFVGPYAVGRRVKLGKLDEQAKTRESFVAKRSSMARIADNSLGDDPFFD